MCALTKENIKLPLQCIAIIYEKWIKDLLLAKIRLNCYVLRMVRLHTNHSVNLDLPLQIKALLFKNWKERTLLAIRFCCVREDSVKVPLFRC